MKSSEQEKENLLNKIENDSNNLKYFIKDNRLFICLIKNNGNIMMIADYNLSKDKTSIVLTNGLISLKNTFRINYNNFHHTYSSNIIKISLVSDDIFITILEYEVSKDILNLYEVEVTETISKVIVVLSKIFNDVFENYDYEYVRLISE